ncbi:WecB/TagA/CpsF family glycosyltransferase [Devosia oryzisoli]|nr:WecB/TagA/CpsF family glycosyltransferase [Devosia oryzisoli]
MSSWARHPLLSARRRDFLGAPLHDLDMSETLDLAVQAMRERTPMLHSVVNVAKLVNMGKSAELFEDVAGADIINVDGAGVLWGARLLGLPVRERVAGVDVMEQLLARCAEEGLRPYLLGAERAVLDAMAATLGRRHPNLALAGMQHGYFDIAAEEEVVEVINASGADCLFVALPTPRKERFLKRYRARLLPSFVMGVGGSFDVYGGKVRRAPRLVQAFGLEWLFRVVQEPRRLWRRYFETNSAYLVLIWRALRQRRAL